MSPEYGATCGFFPVDDETLRYLRLTGRSEEKVALVEAYCKETGLWHTPDEQSTYSQVVELDLSTVEPSIAGPRRPQDRIPLHEGRNAFSAALPSFGVTEGNGHVDEAGEESMDGSDAPALTATAERTTVELTIDGETVEIDHGVVVIAAITSCTNTSNPAVMIGAGLLAKKAVERGLTRRPWVKTSLAPGSRVVTEYYEKAGLTPYLEALGFNTVGYGCTTCIGNSGPLPAEVSEAVTRADLVACAVLSGNRNFEARIHPEVKANYLASPPLVVAYALAGRMDIDITTEPLGHDPNGEPVYLADIWPSPAEVQETIEAAIGRDMFLATYANVYEGEDAWRELPVPTGELFEWEDALDLRAPSAVLRRHGPRGGNDRGHQRSALPRLDRRLGHDRPHLAGRLDQARLARGRLPRRARCRARRLQLVRLAPRQPRGDGARHVRERAPAQPARPGLGGNVDRAPPGRRGDDDLRGGRSATSPRACRRSCSPARSTAPARRATGPRRGRTCSACGP